ncbi:MULTISPECIES: helix-turn-helix domain-containing protein [Sporosarcina]|uniref:helix-turn-helix domain-containing protein n=1 Tax=Sporosarcina TaxID=1569 RepID=UPI00058C2211|nr:MULTISPECIES: helix-turn-helix transcriptional regulator [Sporosarcina]WJY26482.1 helix-turn-helix transcriptional regulator [Sporosarcina sp. 0.2-SM1T-5]
MTRKTRHFGKQFKEYREEYLGIKQLEAAEQLSISSSALSNYERTDRDLTSEMLAEFKETFDIPDDYFVAMVTGRPLRDVRAGAPEAAGKTSEIQAAYRDRFVDHHRTLLQESNELREIIAIVASMTEKERRLYLNSIKSNLLVFRSLLRKHGDTGQPLPSPEQE